MNLWQLKILVAVVENKSFSKASEAINLSQPTISSHIKELEGHFQCPLLDRLGKTTEPTRAGGILYEHAKEILALSKKAEDSIQDFLGNFKGALFVGGSTIPSGYIFPKIIGSFSKQFPDVHIEMISGDTTDIIEEIKKGKIDIAIVGAKTDDPSIFQEEFIKDGMRLIIPSDHKWAEKPFVNCLDLFSEPFIKREKGSGTWQTIQNSMGAAGFNANDLKAPVTMGNTVSVIQGILHHVGVSILSTIAVQDEIDKGRLNALSVEDLNLSRFFYLTTSTKRSLSPISQKFMEFARLAR